MSVNKNDINIKCINQPAVSEAYCLDADKSIIKFDTTMFENAAKANFGLSQNVLVNWLNTAAIQYLRNIDNIMENSNSTIFLGNQTVFVSSKESENVIAANMASAVLSINDADVAEESSNYIKRHILQQTSESLLTTANQAPSAAINLV